MSYDELKAHADFAAVSMLIVKAALIVAALELLRWLDRKTRR